MHNCFTRFAGVMEQCSWALCTDVERRCLDSRNYMHSKLSTCERIEVISLLFRVNHIISWTSAVNTLSLWTSSQLMLSRCYNET